jgi:hypothetical protein
MDIKNDNNNPLTLGQPEPQKKTPEQVKGL